jgi:hypothetical protein
MHARSGAEHGRHGKHVGTCTAAEMKTRYQLAFTVDLSTKVSKL